MSNNVPQHYETQFTTNIELLQQKKGSVLLPYLRKVPGGGQNMAVIDQVGSVAAREVTTRYAAITPEDVPVDRRWVAPKTYDWATYVDTFDKLKLLIDPTSIYAEAAAMAMGRQIDTNITTAFFASAKTGVDGTTTTSFSSGQQVAVNTGSSSATVLNMAKVRAAEKLFLSNHYTPADELIMVVDGVQMANMKGEYEATDATNKVSAMFDSNGMITQIGIFKVILCNSLPLDGSSYTRIPVFAKNAMAYAEWMGVSAKVTQRTDLRGQPYQIYTDMVGNATRTQEVGVVEIKCVNS